MTQITTSGGLITFQDTVTGLTKQIGQNQLWLLFNADTVNFLQVAVPTDGSDGTPFWSVRASNLTIDGESYTIEQLKAGEGLGDLFSSMSFTYEIVDELPETGEPNIIYLVYDEESDTYIEYLWLSQEQVYEQLGSVNDVNLANYYTKSEVDTLLSAKANSSSLAAVATSGSYADLSNQPTIPTVDSVLTENSTNAAQSGATYSALANKQDTLVSGTSIKTINNESLLGSGNINISGGGGTQVQSDWTEADTSSMAYIQHKPTNVSAFTNDAGYLTQHQSLADVFADVDYDSSTKHINFYGKGDTSHTTVLAYVDAANFIVDGMVDTVEVKNATVSGQTVLCLVISFNTDAGKQDINIPISQIFDASNYYTKTEIDNKGYLTSQAQADWTEADSSSAAYIQNKPSLATVATSGSYADLSNTPSLATVATTGAYSDLTGTPSIPAAQVQSDWNQSDTTAVDYIKNKPTIPAAPVQSDWNESNSSSLAYIANKPTIPAAITVDTVLDTTSGNPIANSAVATAIGDIETALQIINGTQSNS